MFLFSVLDFFCIQHLFCVVVIVHVFVISMCFVISTQCFHRNHHSDVQDKTKSRSRSRRNLSTKLMMLLRDVPPEYISTAQSQSRVNMHLGMPSVSEKGFHESDPVTRLKYWVLNASHGKLSLGGYPLLGLKRQDFPKKVN